VPNPAEIPKIDEANETSKLNVVGKAKSKHGCLRKIKIEDPNNEAKNTLKE
jgi:hypothetical protein